MWRRGVTASVTDSHQKSVPGHRPGQTGGVRLGPLCQLDQTNSSQSRLSVTPRNHCFKNVELLPVDPNILWQVLLWIRQLGVVRQWQWCCVFVVYFIAGIPAMFCYFRFLVDEHDDVINTCNWCLRMHMYFWIFLVYNLINWQEYYFWIREGRPQKCDIL